MTKRTSVIIIWTPPCLLWKLTKKDFTTEIKYIANHWILLFFFLIARLKVLEILLCKT